MTKSCDLTGKGPFFGKSVSHSHQKTNKKFQLNLIKTRLFSSALGRSLLFRVAASTLRTVDYKGGLDGFLLKTKNGKLSSVAKKLKKKILQSRSVSSSE